ncbi:polyketide cyclase [Glaciimonas sp. PCH181]|nr:polyketide cyclase [Glaciimonas sp. PCH181]
MSGANAATPADSATPSGATIMSNADQPSAAQIKENKQTVLAFYEAGLNQKDFAAASQYLGPYYKQHNPRAADGIEGFHNFINFLKVNVPTSHSEIKKVFSDGNFVILHVHKTTSPTDRGVAIIDIFRLEHGKIVEHWDVTQEIPEKTTSGNGMF